MTTLVRRLGQVWEGLVMLQLHQFAPAFGVPNPSPFCMKLECFLRMTGISYETVLLADPRKAPKGKGPFVVDDGQRIGGHARAGHALAYVSGSDLGRLDSSAHQINS